ncbi:MAG: hypothetical protein SGI89_02100 [bacterium]|nr:hypothetical protein [bacterium]
MNTLTINKSLLKEVKKGSVREAIIEERKNLYDLLIPIVSIKEMNNIETLYKSPSQYDKKNFKDVTDWIMK